VCQLRNGGTCQAASQSYRSPAGPVYGNEFRTVDGEANFRGDFSGDPSGSGDISKRHTDCTASEGDHMSSDKNSNRQCHSLSSAPPAFKPRESQRSLNAASVPARDLNSNSGWKERYSNEWKNGRKESERGEIVRFDSGEFAESQYYEKTNTLPRRSGNPELTGQQFLSEHMTRNNEIKDWPSLEPKFCQHVNLVAGARPQQRCAVCHAEGDVKSVNGNETANFIILEKGAVPIVGGGTLIEEKEFHKGYGDKNSESLVWEEGYNIDARVEKLMLNFPLVQGREQDSVAGMSF
jgi:hypothetical protein